jgi:hypothetical protein
LGIPVVLAFTGTGALCQSQFTAGWCSPAIKDVGGSVEVYTGTAPPKAENLPPQQLPHPDQGQIFQSTTGDNSPVIADVKGNVRIVCNGINPAAVEKLNQELNTLKLSEQARLERANEWAQQYKNQEAKLANWQIAFKDVPSIRGLVDQAAKLLNEGDLEGSGKVLDQLAAKAEEAREQISSFETEIIFERAQNLDLQFRFSDALLKYKKSHTEAPNNLKYAFAYAIALQRLDKPDEEERTYGEILGAPEEPRPLPSDPNYLLWETGATETDLWKAKARNNLTGLYVASNRLDKLIDPSDVSVPASAINFRTVDDAVHVLQSRLMRSRLPPNASASEVNQEAMRREIEMYSAELTRVNNTLVILDVLQRGKSADTRNRAIEIQSAVNLPEIWAQSLPRLEALFNRAEYLNRSSARQLINGSFMINGFDAAMNLTDLICRDLRDPEITQQPPTAVHNGLTPSSICSALPGISEEFITKMRKLNLVFYLPVAARRYRQNFLLLSQMDHKIVASLSATSSEGDWARKIEDQGEKAESAYLALLRLNPQLYRRDCVSFLREEAGYYEKSRAIEKSVAISRKLGEIDPEKSIRVNASGNSLEWINYVN